MFRRFSVPVRGLQTARLVMEGPRSREGFTVLELMIVLVIIGVGAALAAPGIGSAISDSRAADVAVDLMRLGREARSEPLTNGRAHVLHYEAGAEGTGRLELYRGTNNGCNTQVWDLAAEDRIDEVVADDYNPDASHTIRVTSDAQVDLCYQPNGAVMVRAAGGGRFGWSHPDVQTGVVFTVTHEVAGDRVGVDREVVFPLGGTARIR